MLIPEDDLKTNKEITQKTNLEADKIALQAEITKLL